MKHIVLVTYGEPSEPGFANQLRYSWRLMKGVASSTADISKLRLPWIALSRAYERNALWRRHAYRSPLEPVTLAQAAQLRNALARLSQEPLSRGPLSRGPLSRDRWKVHAAYEFREPFLRSLIKRLPRKEPVIIVPMFAADSGFTHDLSRQSADFLDVRRPAPITVLPALGADALAAISVNHVMHMLDAGSGVAESTALVLAARGMRLGGSRVVETGRDAMEHLCHGISKRLAGHFGMVASGWLNHGRGSGWTFPPIQETLRRVSEAGFRDVVYYPYGFLADNAESQLEGQLAAATRPELQVRFVPCLNGSFELAEAIAKKIITAHSS
jgi:protoheme ferro-lyase